MDKLENKRNATAIYQKENWKDKFHAQVRASKAIKIHVLFSLRRDTRCFLPRNPTSYSQYPPAAHRGASVKD